MAGRRASKAPRYFHCGWRSVRDGKSASSPEVDREESPTDRVRKRRGRVGKNVGDQMQPRYLERDRRLKDDQRLQDHVGDLCEMSEVHVE